MRQNFNGSLFPSSLLKFFGERDAKIAQKCFSE